ncbi:hypothetical protein ABZV34_39110, partial [Streptomyces sp. NPDC005195]
TPAQSSGAKPPAYSAVTGPGCTAWGYQEHGVYTKGDDGWRRGTHAWSQNGCNGSYSALPLSGGSSPNSGLFAEWLFAPNLTSSASCTLLVYIPPVSDRTMVGGNPAYYTVYRAYTPSANNVIGSFQINQAAHLGRWVTAGSYPGRAKLAVGLDNRGIDWGSGNEGRHVAAAQVKAVCRN